MKKKTKELVPGDLVVTAKRWGNPPWLGLVVAGAGPDTPLLILWSGIGLGDYYSDMELELLDLELVARAGDKK